MIGYYNNGNYTVKLYKDGTKIRCTEFNEFIPNFPESMDLKITNYCDLGCPYCHEDSNKDGKHGDIMGMKFIDTLHPYTELAIGGGNPLSHPELLRFLYKLKERGLIPSITVNLTHLLINEGYIDHLVGDKLVYGIGVSINSVDDDVTRLINKYDNLVLHVINGLIEVPHICNLYGTQAKVLILGYKELRRGARYYNPTVEKLKKSLRDNIPEIIHNLYVTSFDNLAIEQLDLKSVLPEKEWEQFYMGDDGKYTLYVDGVEGEYAKSSTSSTRYPIENNILKMFNTIRSG